jgi:hypothetical protein
MTETTVESVFGIKAGIVWEALNKSGPTTIDNIVKATGLRRELVYGALGWLGRENKISVNGQEEQWSSHYDNSNDLVIIGRSNQGEENRLRNREGWVHSINSGRGEVLSSRRG